MTASDRLRVVYISGYGRSGTTVLDILLAQHQAFTGGGEIDNLARRVWRNNEYCSCGLRVRDCKFWSDVVQRWVADRDPDFIDKYFSLQRRVETIANTIRMLTGVRDSTVFEAYAHQTVRLFDAIRSVSGTDVIIDSSKVPTRAFALAFIPNIDLHVIHVVRDGRGVAWSLLQSHKADLNAGLQRDIDPRSVVYTAARWSTVNLATEALNWRVGPGRFTRVRYEDFTAEPASTFERIGQSLGYDLSHVGALIQGGKQISPKHQISGNRLRMQRSIKVVQDESWRDHMPSRQQAVFGWLCGWLLKRYGYVYWPVFRRINFLRAIRSFQQRKRRFWQIDP